MLACTVDHLTAVEGALQMVPKSQVAASSVTSQEQETAASKREGRRKKENKEKLLTYTWGNQV